VNYLNAMKNKLIIKFFYSQTEAPVNCLKNNIKIDIKTAPTYFGAITSPSGSALFELAKVTVVKIIKIHRCVVNSVVMWLLI
jgi:hypothetical protein